MKRRLCCLLLALLLAAGLAGCGGGQAAAAVLVLSRQEHNDENAFLRSAWDGIERYCGPAGIATARLEAEMRTEAAQLAAVDEAVDAGAEVIVLPGYRLETTAFTAQDAYPDVHFVLVDGMPNNGDALNYVERAAANTCALMYAEEQAGFLAGYAAVADGFTRLGFFGGMSVPAVMRFGYGYLQGAEYAAARQGLGAGSVELRYLYCGEFAPQPQYQAKAASWYWDGTEVIFACGGAMGSSVIAAAEADDSAWVIGVDVDQSGDSERVLTSAVKQVSGSVHDAVAAHFAGEFPGGRSIHLGAAEGGVGLAMDTARFENFGLRQYEEIYTALATDADGITSGILKDDVDIEAIPLHCVRLALDSVN